MFVKIKRFFIFLAVCFMLIPVTAVYADVIVEPVNDFFHRHRNECVYVDHSFYVNGENGSVSLKKEPGSKEEVAVIQNNEILYISYTYNYNGEAWGVAEINNPNQENRWVYGWVPLSQLVLIYDYHSFEEDHKSEFKPYTGDYHELLTADQIVYWKYPGSGIVIGTMKDNVAEFVNNFVNSLNKGEIIEPYILNVYTDEQGREWGFTGWGGPGGKDLWICLSDPANSDIPANTKNSITSVRMSDENADSPDTGISMMSITIILVTVLVVGTGILIRVLWKHNKNQ